MKTWTSRSAWILVALLAVPTAGLAAETAGRVLSIEGEPRVERADGRGILTLKRNDPIYVGDVIRTGQGRAKIMFEDNSLMTLDRDTEIKISEYLYEPAEKKRSSLIDVFSGKVKSLVGKLFSRAPDFKVRTPTAVAGVRGTYFRIDVGNGNDSTVTVFSGSVNVDDIGGASHLLGQGAQVSAGQGGFTGSPRQLPPQVLNALEQELEVRPQDALQEGSGEQVNTAGLAQAAVQDAMQRRGGPTGLSPGGGDAEDEGEDSAVLDDAPETMPAAPPINLESVDPSTFGQVRINLQTPEVQ